MVCHMIYPKDDCIYGSVTKNVHKQIPKRRIFHSISAFILHHSRFYPFYGPKSACDSKIHPLFFTVLSFKHCTFE